MLVSKNGKICVTPNANGKIWVTPNANPQRGQVEYFAVGPQGVAGLISSLIRHWRAFFISFHHFITLKYDYFRYFLFILPAATDDPPCIHTHCKNRSCMHTNNP